jgi:hypothetical protein
LAGIAVIGGEAGGSDEKANDGGEMSWLLTSTSPYEDNEEIDRR